MRRAAAWRPVLATVAWLIAMTASIAAQTIWAGEWRDRQDDGGTGRASEGQPEIVIRASEQLLSRLLEQPIDATVPFDDVILGTHVVGPARVQGQTRLDCRPDSAEAAVELVFSGTVAARTVGTNGPARIESVTTGSVVARKRLWIGPDGIRVDPCSVQSDTHIAIQDVGAAGLGHRIVEDLAWKRCGLQQDEAERIVAGKIEAAIGRVFDARVDSYLRLVRSLNQAVAVRNAIDEHLGGADDWSIDYATDDNGLLVLVWPGNAAGKTAPGDAAAPASKDMDSLIAIRVRSPRTAALKFWKTFRSHAKRETAVSPRSGADPATLQIRSGYESGWFVLAVDAPHRSEPAEERIGSVPSVPSGIQR